MFTYRGGNWDPIVKQNIWRSILLQMWTELLYLKAVDMRSDHLRCMLHAKSERGKRYNMYCLNHGYNITLMWLN